MLDLDPTTTDDRFVADDPLLAVWTRTQRPPIAPQHLLNARLQHAAAIQELEDLDRELEVLAGRRRWAVERLRRLRSRLWLGPATDHRRRGPIGTPPMPPVAPGARSLCGRELRATAVAILHRHGTCSLRELHGLLHRYGYVLAGGRSVQRLADAMGYETEQGRVERVRRGVYRAVVSRPQRRLPDAPLPWRDPDPVEPRPDALVADDPERWSAGHWPTSGLPRDADDPHPDPEGEELDELIRLTRQRVADLIETVVGRRGTDSRSARIATSFDARWRRFAVESVPEVERWLAKGERWPWKTDTEPGGDVAGGRDDPRPGQDDPGP